MFACIRTQTKTPRIWFGPGEYWTLDLSCDETHFPCTPTVRYLTDSATGDSTNNSMTTPRMEKWEKAIKHVLNLISIQISQGIKQLRAMEPIEILTFLCGIYAHKDDGVRPKSQTKSSDYWIRYGVTHVGSYIGKFHAITHWNRDEFFLMKVESQAMNEEFESNRRCFLNVSNLKSTEQFLTQKSRSRGFATSYDKTDTLSDIERALLPLLLHVTWFNFNPSMDK